MGESTVLKKVEDGVYEMRALSPKRFTVRIAVSLIRAVMAAFMVTQGTQFLVYTTEISDLLLNAVALEFVINTDELVYEALAPSRAKRILCATVGFKMKPQPTFGGVDFRGVLTILFVIGGSALTPAFGPRMSPIPRVRCSRGAPCVQPSPMLPPPM